MSRSLAPNPIDDPADFDTLTPAQRACVLAWIASTFEPARRGQRRCKSSSYGLKHDYERGAGPGYFYLTNGMMKGAMLAAGWQPQDPAAQNWTFRDLAVRRGPRL